MNLRWKLSLSFLLVSLLTAATVGITAWWMIVKDFKAAVQQHAFENFQEDILAYISRYGDWETAQASQPFTQFVRQRRAHQPPPNMPPPKAGPDGPFIRAGMAPFHFLLIGTDGRALSSVDEFIRGELVSKDVMDLAKPIMVRGQLALYAAPLGEPLLSNDDKEIIAFMERALLIGMLVAAVLAIILGTLFSTRIVAKLRLLANAINSMRPDGEIPKPLEINSQDEIGLLAGSFNRMSRQLMEAHQDLRTLNTAITGQAEELRELSLRDPLTGLYNRRYFNEQADPLYNQAIRHKHPLCVMLADLDHFKSINDTYSHAIGDQVLLRVAEILRKNIRNSDLLARFGGEEFIVVFAESNLDQARQRCELLRQHIQDSGWHDIASTLKVTISIGLCDDSSLGSLNKMLEVADENLYRAKHNGRNRVEPAALTSVKQHASQ